ncbi:MAG: flagellar basal body-associated FliL family protein [Sporomusaceae bacterium]|nr:flagellar basal body-associated FliL family protein [Sporomusaceae bacterium]
MAQEEVAEKKKVSSLVIGLIVACLILAGGVGYLIYMKVAGPETETPVREPGVLFKLGDVKDGLILNIGGVNSGRYLKIGIIVELKPGSQGEVGDGKNITAEQAKILDTVVQLLRSQKVEDFDPSKQLQLKDLIKHEIGLLLGEDNVYDVYITNFILQ